MTTVNATIDGAWVPLAEAAAAYGVSVDTIRRRLKAGQVRSRMAGKRFLVHVADELLQQARPTPIAVVEESEIRLVLQYLRERDQARDAELHELRAELANTRAELVRAQLALPSGRSWNPLEWVFQLWSRQMRTRRITEVTQTSGTP